MREGDGERRERTALRKRPALAATCAAALILAGLAPASAHHSRRAYDRDTQTSITGTVTKFELVNPHAWIHLVVAKPDGSTEDWSFEGGSVRRLNSAGWTRDMMKAGDIVTVEYNPKRDGTPGGIFRTVTLADGTTVSSLGRRQRSGPAGVAIRWSRN